MSSQPRFGLVTPEQVRGALKATGSKDPDVLAAALDQLAAPYRPLKWFGIWGIVTGVLCCLLIILAFIGVPLLFFGWWAMRRARKNRETIQATYEAYLASLGLGPVPGASSVGGAPGMRAASLALLATLSASGLLAQDEEVPPEWRGDYVVATAACTTPVRLRLEQKRIVLVNGNDSQGWGDVDFSHSWWGNSYQGIMFVSMPDFTRSSNSTAGPPFMVTFNDEEKEGMLRVTDLKPDLARRFPLGDKPLKKCGAGGGASAAPRQAAGCEGGVRCEETPTFTAIVSDVRTSTSGRDRLVAVTLHVRNRMSEPLTLAYVQHSGLVTDDQGNRYALNGASALRGLGEVSGRIVDPKFSLAPREEADARLEFIWRPTSGKIYGTVYNLDLSIRELNPLPGNQWELGREHTLQYRDLSPANGAVASAGVASGAAQSTGPAVMASCEGRPRCVASGGFTADVTNVVPSVSGRHHLIQVTLKVTNAGSQPVILGYKSGSSGAVDNLGNRYYYGRAGTHDTSFRGIGLVTGQAADPQFQVAPGSSRTATFQVVRFEGARALLGNSWTWDVALEELEILPSRQVREGREHALSFPDLAAGGGSGDPVSAAASSVVEGVKGIFGGKKK